MQKLLFTLLFISVLLEHGYSQDNTDIDKTFYEAKELAGKKAYSEARTKARLILAYSPNYYDAGILIARTYAWEGKYDSARVEINSVLKASPNNRDAINAAIDIEFWQNNFNKAMEFVEYGLSKYPDDKDFLLRKAQILMAMGKEREAKIILTRLLQKNPYDYQVNSLLGGTKYYRNRMIVEHTLDIFSKPYNHLWQVTSLQYQREAYWGTWVGKLNAGDLFIEEKRAGTSTEFQLEADAYPVLSTSSYMYLNYGYSWGDFFPTNRSGIEYFQSFDKGWEASLGGRYLNFKNSSVKHTIIVTGSVGKYFANNWLSFRPYYIFNYKNISQSYFLFYRHYLNDPLNYLGGAVGFGTSPDEASNKNFNIFRNPYESYRLRFDFQHKLGNRFILRVMIGNNYDEYINNSYRYRFDSNIYLAWLF